MFLFEWLAVRGHTGSIENIDSLIDSLSLVNFRCLFKRVGSYIDGCGALSISSIS